MAGFQRQVNLTPAPAVNGDWASANTPVMVVATEGSFVASSTGATVGAWGWVQSDNRTVKSTGGAGIVPDGFVHREQQTLITAFLGEAANSILSGMPVTLTRNADLYVTTTTVATKGQKVFAVLATGATATGAAGATIAGAVETPWTVQTAAAIGEVIIMSNWS